MIKMLFWTLYRNDIMELKFSIFQLEFKAENINIIFKMLLFLLFNYDNVCSLVARDHIQHETDWKYS